MSMTDLEIAQKNVEIAQKQKEIADDNYMLQNDRNEKNIERLQAVVADLKGK